ncbi:MAG: hypothetical protein HC933_06840 [Pleurocapsa sp. SU_196_0]|nr:hypothetical protein [Pleurocapsa sp. SU_196_0]
MTTYVCHDSILEDGLNAVHTRLGGSSCFQSRGLAGADAKKGAASCALTKPIRKPRRLEPRVQAVNSARLEAMILSVLWCGTSA